MKNISPCQQLRANMRLMTERRRPARRSRSPVISRRLDPNWNRIWIVSPETLLSSPSPVPNPSPKYRSQKVPNPKFKVQRKGTGTVGLTLQATQDNVAHLFQS